MNKIIVNNEQIISLLRETLSKKRFQHSINVADEAKKLAFNYNGNIKKCYTAGLLHDIKKEENLDQMKSLAMLCDIKLEPIEVETPALWHAPASAFYAKKVLGINDDEILGAIRWHTAGKPDMNLTEKIVYLADLISADRNYEDVGIMRKLAYSDIDYAMYIGMKFAIDDVTKKDAKLAISSVLAYNYYQRYNKKEIL